MKKIWNKLGPFDWDLMATTANVNNNPLDPLCPFIPGTLMPSQRGSTFSPSYWMTPVAHSASPLKYKENLCAVNAPWVIFMKEHLVDSVLVSKPFDNRAFTITHFHRKEGT